jgi:hypothetical protein
MGTFSFHTAANLNPNQNTMGKGEKEERNRGIEDGGRDRRYKRESKNPLL